MVVEHDEGRGSPVELGGPVGTSDGHRLEVYGRMGDHLWTMMEQVAGTGMVVDPDVNTSVKSLGLDIQTWRLISTILIND